MIDLHVHSIFSDGELIPSEIARRMVKLGNEGVAITDHADFSIIPWIMDCLRRMQDLRDDYELEILFGIEVTHVPPRLIGRAVELAWKEGAEIVVVHGETIVEPVKKGTNFAAVQEEIDILAHPGIVDMSTAELAASNGVFLEITARKGHCLTNGHVARIARQTGCKLIISTDAHSPFELINTELARKILIGASIEESDGVLENAKKIVRKKA
jgi:histidinol phosphatase-like PHP family hydrolase